MSGNPSEYENRDYCSQKNGRGPPAESEVRWQSTPSKRLRISLAPGMLDFSKLSRVFTQFKSPSGCPRMGQPVPVHAQRVDIVFAVIS